MPKMQLKPQLLRSQAGFGIFLELLVVAMFLGGAAATVWKLRNVSLQRMQLASKSTQTTQTASSKTVSTQATNPPPPAASKSTVQAPNVKSGIKGRSVVGASTGCFSGSNSSSCGQPPPIQSVIDIRASNGTREGGKIIATAKTDANGNFSFDIAPGTYVVSPEPTKQMSASTELVTISSGQYVNAMVTYN